MSESLYPHCVHSSCCEQCVAALNRNKQGLPWPCSVEGCPGSVAVGTWAEAWR